MAKRLEKRSYRSKSAQAQLVKVKKSAQQLDEKKRTFEGIVYPSVEEARAAEQEIFDMRSLTQSYDNSTEEGVRALHTELQKFSARLSAPFVEEVEARLRKFEEERTFQGVLYSSQQEIAVAKAEWDKANDMFQANAVSSLEDAEALFARLKQHPFTTKGPEEVILRVEKAIVKIQTDQRTYNGVIYESADEAARAKIELAEIKRIMDTKATEASKVRKLLAKLDDFHPKTAEPYKKELRAILDKHDRTYKGKEYRTFQEAEQVKVKELLKKAQNHQKRRDTGIIMKIFLYLLGIGFSLFLIGLLNAIGLVLVCLGYLGYFVSIREEKKAWKELTSNGRKALPK
ncbi:hypothetical protein P9314_11055 [Paenibacillus validus]|uniref:hypothetical protein n=1 Tax=Paenibacillus validus TaxID=44253 RepID=UPI000FD9ED86|nr:hypothetical protein [Paenibacillus validus]MED4601243.1 hypothetical protein [Paenibacillus validus]MED4607503.1 hypothetical protein [Paenibacillus validus]